MKTVRLVDDQRGVAAMEFALVAPMLLLIVFAAIDYGWYLTQNVILNNAVTAAARAGIKAREWTSSFPGEEREEEDPEVFARTAFQDALWTFTNFPPERLEVRILDAEGERPRRIVVRATDVPYRPLSGYLGESLMPKVMAAKATMAFP
ncbi:MAG: TadE/TadG family type IV pilus assembly protein [Desulfobulbus sp.]|jgi:Flp pilus assembly pilin Flp